MVYLDQLLIRTMSYGVLALLAQTQLAVGTVVDRRYNPDDRTFYSTVNLVHKQPFT